MSGALPYMPIHFEHYFIELLPINIGYAVKGHAILLILENLYPVSATVCCRPR
jgi:hypothetical protein